MDYHLKTYGLIKFRYKIYVLDSSELKKTILRGFHAKPCLGHRGYQNTLTTVKNIYHWSNLKKDVIEFVARCLDCQQLKAECKHPSGLLQPILIPEWKWEVISMYFIIGFLRTSRQHDSIMVVVDMLKKVVHLIPVKITYLTSDVAQFFIRDVVRLHGVPKKIVSERDVKFTSKFLKELFVGLGTELAFNTTYHLHTDGQKKRDNKILEDMLRMYVMHQQRRWEEYHLLVEFFYNNGYQESLRISMLEAFYGKSCNTPISWSDLMNRVFTGLNMLAKIEHEM